MASVRRAGRVRAKSTPPPSINLSLAVRNFGPVTRADINIRPLTILIGPNNSGKSYVATLLRSIFAAQSRVASARFEVRSASEACEEMLKKKYKQDKYKMVITKQESKKILTALLDEEMAPTLEMQIARDFGSDMRHLVQTGKGSSSVEVLESDSGSSTIRKMYVKLGKDLSVKTTLKPTGHIVEAVQGRQYYHVSTYERHRDKNNAERRTRGSPHILPGKLYLKAGVGDDPEIVCHLCAVEITDSISGQFYFKTVPRNTYYFPAARSGILQGHKALSASIVAHAPYGGIEAFEIPRVTGVIGDFISRIILLRRTKGPFAAMAGKMENELFGGNIVLDTTTKNEYPEITYRHNGSAMPLHRSSSTISEIAPLSLYLKHIVDENSFLIIEEPEAHLHPANQIVLAKYIVKLIRSGVNILMTTHSIFLLDKLAKYMMAGSLTPEQRLTDLGYGQDGFLTQDEVSVYLFERRPDGGHQTKPVERDEEYGISQEEFIKVSEALHRETIIINSKMQANANA